MRSLNPFRVSATYKEYQRGCRNNPSALFECQTLPSPSLFTDISARWLITLLSLPEVDTVTVNNDLKNSRRRTAYNIFKKQRSDNQRKSTIVGMYCERWTIKNRIYNANEYKHNRVHDDGFEIMGPGTSTGKCTVSTYVFDLVFREIQL